MKTSRIRSFNISKNLILALDKGLFRQSSILAHGTCVVQVLIKSDWILVHDTTADVDLSNEDISEANTQTWKKVVKLICLINESYRASRDIIVNVAENAGA
jgi:hypothetical protein